ncbi:MAG: Glutamyl-tRNA(Gln) amidotransferase subunit A-like protein, partial [uncultured Thermomicrobiales bacterium]
MAHEPIGEGVLARLRANAAAAGIALGEDDLARMAAGPFLHNVEAFARLVERTPPDMVPDQLKDWTNGGPGARGEERGATRDGADDGADPTDPFAPLHVVAAAIERREVSPRALTELMLARIEAHDPALNAFQLVLRDEALAAAGEAEREIAGGRYRGPFHGVPVAVKDLLAMRGTPTTAGSKILADWMPGEDAEAVRRLREAGAVIVGKTRMSEFAYSPGSNNAHYGPTRNPWNPERDTGGSSSGSGAAVAAGLAYAALGSDTGGSIRMPAALCGIVGLKPTFGLLSLAGAVTLSWSLDHLGPLTRTVRDAA